MIRRGRGANNASVHDAGAALSFDFHCCTTMRSATSSRWQAAGAQKELIMHTHTTSEAGKAPIRPMGEPSVRATITPNQGLPGTVIRLLGEDVTTAIHRVVFKLNDYVRAVSVTHIGKGEAETTVPNDVPRNARVNVEALDLNGNNIGLLGYFDVPR
jgi:hypothetical protein